MTEPKKPAQPASASVRKVTIEEIQRDANAARGEWAASAPQRAKTAREAADAELDAIADRAIEWKKLRGVYPWEEPETQAGVAQAQWLKNSGIDPERVKAEGRQEILDRIHVREAQKKTDGQRSR